MRGLYRRRSTSSNKQPWLKYSAYEKSVSVGCALAWAFNLKAELEGSWRNGWLEYCAIVNFWGRQKKSDSQNLAVLFYTTLYTLITPAMIETFYYVYQPSTICMH